MTPWAVAEAGANVRTAMHKLKKRKRNSHNNSHNTAMIGSYSWTENAVSNDSIDPEKRDVQSIAHPITVPSDWQR
jgi:hypothetical protein